jgi:hypothetical protein
MYLKSTWDDFSTAVPPIFHLVTATQPAFKGANPYAYYHPEKVQAPGIKVVSPCITPGTLAAHGVRVSIKRILCPVTYPQSIFY